MPKSNSSRKVPQMPAPATSKRGRNGEEPAAFQSEGAFFKLWESEGRIDWPEHTAGGLQNKETEKLQRRAEKSRPIPAGGRRQGEGQGSGRKLDTEKRANRSQINKGNRFRKVWCNRLKSLKVTPTTPEEAYRYQEV